MGEVEGQGIGEGDRLREACGVFGIYVPGRDTRNYFYSNLARALPVNSAKPVNAGWPDLPRMPIYAKI